MKEINEEGFSAHLCEDLRNMVIFYSKQHNNNCASEDCRFAECIIEGVANLLAYVIYSSTLKGHALDVMRSINVDLIKMISAYDDAEIDIIKCKETIN